MSKPPIRLKFREPEVDPSPPDAGVASRSSKTLPPSIGTEKLVVKCGHTITFDLYAKDPFRDGRRMKASSRDCSACRQARVAADAAAAAARKVKKSGQKVPKLRPRLPDGAQFAAVYDAGSMQWTGSLTIDGALYERRAGGIKSLLDRLDDAYRETLPP